MYLLNIYPTELTAVDSLIPRTTVTQARHNTQGARAEDHPRRRDSPDTSGRLFPPEADQ